MSIIQSEIKSGIIYGDTINNEYVYMPASELGLAEPLCVYEADGLREDIVLAEAMRLIRVRSLKPAKHPLLGASSC